MHDTTVYTANDITIDIDVSILWMSISFINDWIAGDFIQGFL